MSQSLAGFPRYSGSIRGRLLGRVTTLTIQASLFSIEEIERFRARRQFLYG
jgi:hypothetical protein